MSASIRLASLEDRPAIEAIVRRAYDPYIARIGRKPGPLLDEYGALIQGGKVHVLFAEKTIRGLVVLIPEADAMLLDNVAVDPDAQGRGYGRMLMDFAELTARSRGFASIRLYTNEAMSENIALYSRIGFVETHRAEEKGLRRVYMAKRIG